jgi:CheY-like chemotaxis protein
MLGKLLLVDDNPLYRKSLGRNLTLKDYEVMEAEDSQTALAAVMSFNPDVVITDLDMRTRTEGLELVKQLRQLYPSLPVILISAVGTFDEGAAAKESGALYVLSKAQVGKKGESLPDLLQKALGISHKEKSILEALEAIREQSQDGEGTESLAQLKEILADDTLSPYLRGEAFDILSALQSSQVEQETAAVVRQARETGGPSGVNDINIDQELQAYSSLQEDSMDSLKTAEFLFRYQESVPGGYDFSRNIGFSYCFAVENEVKWKFRHRLAKFLKSTSTYELTEKMYDRKMRNMDLFFQQQMIRLQQNKKLDFQVDKIKQVLEKLLLHREHYKPDGLKAMGILVLCYGRNYEMMSKLGKFLVDNPLGLKGLDSEDDILILAHQLIKLQHFRNPYIHPEITVREKIAIIREATLQCLNYVNKIEE